MALGSTQRSQSTREPLRAERRTSGTCYGMSGPTVGGLPVGNPRNINDLNIIAAIEAEQRRPNYRMMRSGKTENAMRAPGMIGSAGRQGRCAIGVVQAELEGRRVVAGIRRQRKSAQPNQQALHGDRIGDSDAYQRSQEPLRLDAQSEFAAHANKLSLRPQPHFFSLR